MAVNEVVVNGVTELSLVNDTVSEETLLDDTTAHDASGNLIVGKAKYINPNLLINPDFSINQRGQTEYSGSKYGADMWISYPSHGIVTVNENGGINLSAAEGVTSGYVRVNQGIETPLVEGEIYTFQVCFDGIVYKKTFVATIDFVSHHFGDSNQYTVYTSCTGFILQLNLSGASTVHIKWVKLELGLVATPFVKPNPAVELVKCQRFYIPASLVGLASSMNSNNLYFFVPLPVEMRVTPSLQNAELAVLNRKNNARLDLTGWTIAIYASVRNGVLLAITKTSHGLDVNDYVAQLTAGGLSAEL